MNDKGKRFWDNSIGNVDDDIVEEMAQTLYKKSLSDTDSDELIVVEEQKKSNRFIFVVAACIVALIGVVTMVSVMLLNGGIEILPTESDTSNKTVIYESDGYEYRILPDGTAEIVKYTGNATELTLPTDINGKKIIAIGENAFADCKELKKLTFSYNITAIGENAFAENIALCIPRGSVAEVYVVSSKNKITFEFTNKPVGDIISSGEYKYQSLSDGTIELVSYNGNDENVVIPETIDGKTVTSVHQDTFQYKEETLISVSLPDTITNIDGYTFYLTENLKEVYLQKNLTVIKEHTFEACDKLEKIEFPQNLRYVEDSAFAYNYALVTLNIPEGTTKIGGSAFFACYNLETVKFPRSLKTIEAGAFASCKLLCSADIGSGNPEDKLVIGESAFKGCANLRTAVIREGVISIGDRAFADSTESPCALEEITLPRSLTHIGEDAFTKSVVLFCHRDSYAESYAKENGLNYVNPIDEEYEKIFGSFEYILLPDDTVEITGYTVGENHELVIPSEIDGKKVTSIGKGAMSVDDLLSVVIPEGVTEIKYEAFKGCDHLTKVSIPDTVTKIGVGAFSNCPYLESVSIPQGVTIINSKLFSGCLSLKSVSLPGTITSVESYAFSDCPSLTKINLNDNITSIGKGAFINCEALEEINIPASVTVIEESVFENCHNLLSATIPDSVTKIGYGAFSICTKLAEVKLPSSLQLIDAKAFLGCTAISSVEIPDSVEVIGDSAFSNCSSLESAKLSSKLKSIGNFAFSDCPLLSQIAIGEWVDIGLACFEHCRSLEKIEVGIGTTVTKEAISGCPKAVIYCYMNSYAYDYAVQNGLEYEIIETDTTQPDTDDIYSKFGHIKYTCDLSAFPADDTRNWFGEIILVEDGRLLISPGLDKGKMEFGEVVWLINDYAYAYSVGQIVTYEYRDVKAPEKEGYPLNIVALQVYME
ncbi:MAG: leucine-rich repeat protein [Ruminiclostridium sp.]|nr:leucine-rich repeat protein [Ruminiclostridium sp.]